MTSTISPVGSFVFKVKFGIMVFGTSLAIRQTPMPEPEAWLLTAIEYFKDMLLCLRSGYAQRLDLEF